MNYHENIVSNEQLKDSVLCYWKMTGKIPDTEVLESRATPKGQHLLIFNFGAPLELVLDNKTIQLSKKFFAFPSTVSSPLIRQKGNVDLFGISLIGEGLYKLTNQPVWKLFCSFPESLTPTYKKLYEQLLDLSFEEKCMMTEQFLSIQLNHKQHNSTLQSALAEINNSNGVVRLKSLSESLSISQRQLQRLFKNRMGISPKDYCKIVRVNSYLLYLLENDGTVDYMDLVVEYDYHDQPHLINEVKSIVNLSPKNLLEYRDTLYHQYNLIS
jgi:AraC-like DNA-binding protein